MSLSDFIFLDASPYFGVGQEESFFLSGKEEEKATLLPQRLLSMKGSLLFLFPSLLLTRIRIMFGCGRISSDVTK